MGGERAVPAGAKWSVDTTRWPILVVTQHVAQLTDDERRQSLEATDRAIETDNRLYAVVHDSRKAGALTAKQRAMIAEFGKRHEDRTKRRCVAIAFVFDSALMRHALTAIFWLKPPVVETRVFASLGEAEQWCRAQLDARQSASWQASGMR